MPTAVTKPKIGKVVEMLDALAAKAGDISGSEFTAAVSEAARAYPAGETAFFHSVARLCRTAPGTVSRWREGWVRPAGAARKAILKNISDELYRHVKFI